ncbi:ABC transporter substrate-binding protein [Jiulongibacter sp. NS-SX5]|uniref:ABC transporter substrate-binding protein n=1 Tax=Jiulongibacter sp. NS-SX5 TaxID=3463854 RepID=UPI0040591046
MRFIFVLALFCSLQSMAQLNADQYLIRYKEGVQAYAAGQYATAMDIFTPLTSRDYNNAASPYVLYYYALASLEDGKGYQARATLRDLMLRYENWEKLEEAYYLYAYSNFVDNYYDEGLSYLERLNDKKLQEDGEVLKKKYINQLDNVLLLKELNEKYPADELIARQLVKKIQARSYNTRADLELSDLLTNRFKIESEVKKKVKSEGAVLSRPYDDDVIDFGVLLPFDLDDFDVSKAAGSRRFVYDLYTGMKLAEQKLKAEEINVRIYGFDVGRTAESIEKYTADDDFKKLDIVVGPLYGKPNEIIEEYAEENSMYQVHPISNNSTLVKDFESRFLLQSSNEVTSQKTLAFVSTLGLDKTVCIYHDGSRNDSLLADAYAFEAKKQGFKVLQVSSISVPEDIQEGLTPGHVFITGNTGFGTKAMRMLSQKGIDKVVFSTSGAFNLETISRGYLNRELYLIYPEFTNSESKEFKDFKRAYIKKMNALPSYYTYLGYDFVIFYGRMMKDGKEIFRLNMDESPDMNDLLLAGFDYSNKSSENQKVPIVKYNHGMFEIVND